MGNHTRRKFLAGTGAAATVGLAGCSALLDNSGGTVGSVETVLPNSIYLPWARGGMEQGLFEEAGVELDAEFKGFGAYAQSVGNDVSVGNVPLVPYISNIVQGDDYVIFGRGQGSFLGINGIYVRADSDYESISDLEGGRIGVWSWGSSTVQSFQALIANQTGLNLREDFETTTAAPPALQGLLDDGEVDAIIEISGLSIALQADDNYRRLAQLNELWIEESGHPLAITMWFAERDWYENNTDAAQALLDGSVATTEYWRENTKALLEEWGEAGGVGTSEAELDVVDGWTQDGTVFAADPGDGFVDAAWDYLDLLAEYDFLDDVPNQGDTVQSP